MVLQITELVSLPLLVGFYLAMANIQRQLQMVMLNQNTGKRLPLATGLVTLEQFIHLKVTKSCRQDIVFVISIQLFVWGLVVKRIQNYSLCIDY